MNGITVPLEKIPQGPCLRQVSAFCSRRLQQEVGYETLGSLDQPQVSDILREQGLSGRWPGSEGDCYLCLSLKILTRNQ